VKIVHLVCFITEKAARRVQVTSAFLKFNLCPRFSWVTALNFIAAESFEITVTPNIHAVRL